jgi:hypothetical protein
MNRKIDLIWTGGNCRAWGFYLPSGRYIVATDRDGSAKPSADDWMVGVYANETAWLEGSDNRTVYFDNTYGDAAQDADEAAALLALADALWQSAQLDHDGVMWVDIDQATCIADPARGDEARGMLDDLAARVGFDSELIARVWLFTADRDNLPADADYWTATLADAYHVMTRG